jgi:hypothetical protein
VADQWFDSVAGLVRRTGPTTVELVMPETGEVYRINWAAMPSLDPDWDPRLAVDALFLPDPEN